MGVLVVHLKGRRLLALGGSGNKADHGQTGDFSATDGAGWGVILYLPMGKSMRVREVSKALPYAIEGKSAHGKRPL